MTMRGAPWLAALALSCAVGPNFHRPPPPAVGRYTGGAGVRGTIAASGAAQVVRPGAELQAAWWQLFHSRELEALVAQALAHNPDLAAARASLRRSRYALEAGYGVFWPQVDASAGANRERFSGRQFGIQSPPSEFSLYTVQGTISYPLDVFGGERRTVEGLRAQVDEQCFSLAAAHLTVTGNVVDTAIAIAAYHAEIATTLELLANLRAQVSIAETQARAGTGTYVNALALRGQLATEAATLPPLRERLDQAQDLLATLAGNAPAAQPSSEIDLAALVLPHDLPVTLPSQLVRRRPDILVAEAALHAASAQIGVATAAMFPRITLGGSTGFTGTTLSNLFTPASWLWNFGANLTAPLFHGGTLNAQRKEAIAAYDQALASYRRVVLAALADVANALWALQHDAEALDAEDHAVSTWQEARKLAEASFTGGTVDSTQVLIIEASYLQARLGYIQVQAQRLQDTVALFVALGGGWWTERSSICTGSAHR